MATPRIARPKPLMKDCVAAIEAMIDGASLKGILLQIEQICYLKAQHIEDNWQDQSLAKAWEQQGQKIGMLAEDISWVVR